MSYWLIGYFCCISGRIHRSHDRVVNDHSSVAWLLRYKMWLYNRLVRLNSLSILQLRRMPTKMTLFMQPSIFTNREHPNSILLRHLLWLILWIQVDMLMIGPAMMTTVINYYMPLLVFGLPDIWTWLLNPCVIIVLSHIHATPHRRIMRITRIILRLLGILILIVIIAHNLLNNLLLINIISLKLLSRHNSIVLSVHVVIPLAIIVITIRTLWIVIISIVVVWVWWLALKVVGLALLSLLALYEVWVGLSLFGFVWVVSVFVFELDSALFYDIVSIAQE